ncbi:TetR/AcrR family transcriptional regulator [Yinghuangia aomiensis]
MTADERRASVIRAAMSEFARGGLHGTSTAAIAKRVGVSQPYLFRLFDDKKALFLATVDYCFTRLRDTFDRAVEGLEGAGAMHAMAHAYTDLLGTEPEFLAHAAPGVRRLAGPGVPGADPRLLGTARRAGPRAVRRGRRRTHRLLRPRHALQRHRGARPAARTLLLVHEGRRPARRLRALRGRGRRASRGIRRILLTPPPGLPGVSAHVLKGSEQ